MRDDLGAAVNLSVPPRRVISLVPSLTESIEAAAPGLLVGATDWCTRPAGLEVKRVRGTKNPNLRAIAALRPDLIVGNREENRELDVQRLRAQGFAVWVTRIETLDEAFASLRRLFGEALGVGVPDWLPAAEQAWAPAPEQLGTVAVPIWRDPWMVVGSRTFTGDLLARAGARNVFGGDSNRYPTVDTAQIVADTVLLPDEPYRFTATEGPDALPGRRTALIAGRALTWYGPSLVTARRDVVAAIESAR